MPQPIAATLALSLLGLLHVGCASEYKGNFAPADFRALGITQEEADAATTPSIAAQLDRKPTASFPAVVAGARIQGGEYNTYSGKYYRSGSYTIVTNHDVEKQASVDRVRELPMMGDLIILNPLVLPSKIENQEDMRRAAAAVQADMLAMYTFETTFATEASLAPLGVLTLGILPDKVRRVDTTAYVALIDTRTGFVYGVTQGSAQADRITNAWSSRTSLDAARREAESKAFDELVTNFGHMWTRVINRYGPDAIPTEPAHTDATIPSE